LLAGGVERAVLYGAGRKKNKNKNMARGDRPFDPQNEHTTMNCTASFITPSSRA
jgi:hypothetical protein